MKKFKITTILCFFTEICKCENDADGNGSISSCITIFEQKDVLQHNRVGRNLRWNHVFHEMTFISKEEQGWAGHCAGKQCKLFVIYMKVTVTPLPRTGGGNSFSSIGCSYLEQLPFFIATFVNNLLETNLPLHWCTVIYYIKWELTVHRKKWEKVLKWNRRIFCL